MELVVISTIFETPWHSVSRKLSLHVMPGEQAAMAKVIKSIEAEYPDPTKPSGIAWIPRTWINSYEWEHGFEGEPGSFMVHFAGLGATRLAHMAAAWLDELQRNQAKWEIPVENTSLKDETPEFWREYAAKITGD
jgi:hypothetical protein